VWGMRNKLPFRSATAPATATLSAFAAAAAVAAAITAASGVTTTATNTTPTNLKLIAANPQTELTQIKNNGKTISYRGISIQIPAPDEGVSAAAQSTSGDLSLTATRDNAGKVVVATDKHVEGTAQAMTATATRAAAAKTCTDGSYALSGWKDTSFTWYFNPTGAPAAIRSTAGSAITNATLALTRACGQRKIGLNPTFAGQTGTTPQIGAAGNCTGNDGKNVIGFRAGTGRWLGMTCTYFKTINGKKTVTGTDTALNTQYAFFTSTANCNNAYDLTSVVLHERGHSLGLNHVDQTTHASAVMTPALSPCTIGKRTLGLGDYRGLVALYGTR
jgi:hypothetical protein